MALTHFSPLDGGPAYRLMARTGFGRRDMQGIARTAVVVAAVTWLPLLGLTAAAGTLAGDAVAVTFLRDFAVHARSLVAVPLFLLADAIVGPQLSTVIRQLVDSRIVPESEEPKVERALAEVARARDSHVAEAVLLALAYVGAWIGTTTQASLLGSTWLATTTESGVRLTPAGWWNALVSVPVFQFLFFRWAWRGFVWARFLARMSHLDLRVVATHPDGAGGLAFIARGQTAFGIVIFGLSAVLSASLASEVVYAGGHVMDFRAPLIGYVALAVGVVLGPVIVMRRPLGALRSRALERYSALMTAHNRAFETRWLDGRHDAGVELLGSADGSSLADLAAAYAAVQGMRTVPLERSAVVTVVAAAALPMVPLVALEVPIKDIVTGLIGILA